MIWSALLRPVGPEPLGVYWVRRFVVLVAAVIVLSLVWWSWPSGAGHQPAASAGRATARSSATPAPGATRPPGTTTPGGAPSSQPSGPPDCRPGDLAVSADADASDYPRGVAPQITISVKNSSAGACRIDLGPTARFLTITSGPDRVWSSADCAKASPQLTTLAPGVVQKRVLRWDRQRSQPGCPAPAGATGTAPGTYLAQAHAGGVTTPGAVFHLHS